MTLADHARSSATAGLSRTVGGLVVTLLPARGYETRHLASRGSLGVAIEMQHGVDAIASDRVRPFFAGPYTLAWLPEGCDVYSCSAAGGEYLKIEGVTGPSHREPFNGRRVAGARDAARAVRRWLLHGRVDDSPPAALERLLQLGGVPVAPVDAEHSTGTLDARRLRHVLELVEARLAEPITVASLGASVGLSADHFARVFAKAVGCTPHRYVMERRLERARQRLQATDDTIADVALACGLSSHAHLTRAFRTHYGLVPSAVRGR